MTTTKTQSQSIHRVACKGDIEKLDSLLKHEEINVLDEKERTLLHWAAACNQPKTVVYLLERGISINAHDAEEKTALQAALKYNRTSVIDTLIALQPNNTWKTKYGPSLLEIAILNNKPNYVRKLINHGVAIDAKNDRGSTPLELSKRLGKDQISSLLIQLGADESLVRSFPIRGAYMGLKEGSKQKHMLAPNFISTEEEEFGSVFNQAGTEFYFGVDVGRRNEIRFSKMIDNQWTKPVTLLSHQQYSYNDPFLSNEENKLYFISTRALDGKGDIKDVDIWYIERIEEGWSEPINAGPTINTTEDEYYISFTNDGTMYFASNGINKKNKGKQDHDIYFSKFLDGKLREPVILGSAINTGAYEADVFIAPDESYLIFCSTREEGFGRGDLYISFKNPDGQWTKAINMGEKINTSNYEYCPFVTKDGSHLLFTSNQDIYVIGTDIIERLKKTVFQMVRKNQK